jgi:hypothetical protein
MYQNCPFQGPPKYTQIGIFGMKKSSGNPVPKLVLEWQCYAFCGNDTVPTKDSTYITWHVFIPFFSLEMQKLASPHCQGLSTERVLQR